MSSRDKYSVYVVTDNRVLRLVGKSTSVFANISVLKLLYRAWASQERQQRRRGL
ncbi:hypothetical protein RSAG8_11682, partial [Rhizoctonia solani AG-8 WAC10335]